MKLLLSPHDDDNVLFAAFTCLREKPLVAIVTDAFIQEQRGEVGCDAETRAKESLEAAKVLGCPIVRLEIGDDVISHESVAFQLSTLQNFDEVFVPAIQGGNWQHDLISSVAREVFAGTKITYYATYAKGEFFTPIKGREVIPTLEEKILKDKAMRCYQSQINLPATTSHFTAVIGQSEWLL